MVDGISATLVPCLSVRLHFLLRLYHANFTSDLIKFRLRIQIQFNFERRKRYILLGLRSHLVIIFFFNNVDFLWRFSSFNLKKNVCNKIRMMQSDAQSLTSCYFCSNAGCSVCSVGKQLSLFHNWDDNATSIRAFTNKIQNWSKVDFLCQQIVIPLLMVV
jgi:hypothetical protein